MNISLDSRSISHQSLVKSFKDAIRNSLISVDVEEVADIAEGFKPDIILNINRKKVLVELKKSTYPASVVRSIYQIIGYLNLTSRNYDYTYIVIPKEFIKNEQVGHVLSKISESYSQTIGIIGYFISHNKIFFEIISGNFLVLPNKISSKLTEPISYTKKRVSITSPKSLRVIKYILQNYKFTQLEISSQTNVSLGQVNKVVSYLRERNILLYRGKYLTLIDPWKLLNDISWSRSMNKLKISELYISDKYNNIEELEKIIRDICKNNNIDYAFTLFSAAKKYSPYIKKYDVIQIYINKPEALNQNIFQEFIQKDKGNNYLEIYQVDLKEILNESIVINGYKVCSKIQTIIDLVSYGSTGKEAAIELYSKIRGD